MKVLRSDEWTPLVWMPAFPFMEGPVYVFLNKRFKDAVALNEAKYVDVTANNVFIYDANNRTISLSYNGTVENETSLPIVHVANG